MTLTSMCGSYSGADNPFFHGFYFYQSATESSLLNASKQDQALSYQAVLHLVSWMENKRTRRNNFGLYRRT